MGGRLGVARVHLIGPRLRFKAHEASLEQACKTTCLGSSLLACRSNGSSCDTKPNSPATADARFALLCPHSRVTAQLGLPNADELRLLREKSQPNTWREKVTAAATLGNMCPVRLLRNSVAAMRQEVIGNGAVQSRR